MQQNSPQGLTDEVGMQQNSPQGLTDEMEDQRRNNNDGGKGQCIHSFKPG